MAINVIDSANMGPGKGRGHQFLIQREQQTRDEATWTQVKNLASDEREQVLRFLAGNPARPVPRNMEKEVAKLRQEDQQAGGEETVDSSDEDQYEDEDEFEVEVQKMAESQADGDDDHNGDNEKGDNDNHNCHYMQEEEEQTLVDAMGPIWSGVVPEASDPVFMSSSYTSPTPITGPSMCLPSDELWQVPGKFSSTVRSAPQSAFSGAGSMMQKKTFIRGELPVVPNPLSSTTIPGRQTKTGQPRDLSLPLIRAKPLESGSPGLEFFRSWRQQQVQQQEQQQQSTPSGSEQNTICPKGSRHGNVTRPTRGAMGPVHSFFPSKNGSK